MNQCPKCKKVNTVTGGINTATFYDWEDNKKELSIRLYWCKKCGKVLGMDEHIEEETNE